MLIRCILECRDETKEEYISMPGFGGADAAACEVGFCANLEPKSA